MVLICNITKILETTQGLQAFFLNKISTISVQIAAIQNYKKAEIINN